jgi:hypothetical protein
MKRIAAEFAPSPAPGAVLWAAVAASALAALVGLALAWDRGQAVREASSELAQLESTRLSAATEQPLALPRRPLPHGAVELMHERALPWPQALNALEAVLLAGIELRSIESSVDDSQIRIEVLASDHDRLLAYLARLNIDSKALAEPHLNWRLLQARQDAATGKVVALLTAASSVVPADPHR